MKHFPALSFATIFFIILSASCANSKKAAVPCPDFSRNRSYKHGYQSKELVNDRILAKGATGTRYQKPVKVAPGQRRNQYFSAPSSFQVRNVMDSANVMVAREKGKLEYQQGLTASLERSAAPLFLPKPLPSNEGSDKQIESGFIAVQPSGCDTIVFKKGTRVIGKVLEIGLSEVKYRECDNPDSPVISISNAEVFVIKYTNGTRDYFHSDNTAAAPQVSTVRKNEGMGTAGFIVGLVGFFIASIPLGIVATVFGIISLGKIKKHPEKYKGKGFAIVSLILGLIDFFGMVIILANS